MNSNVITIETTHAPTKEQTQEEKNDYRKSKENYVWKED